MLEYRGYPIAELCEKSTYLEVAYLLIYGELPTQDQLDEWIYEVTHHTFVHENIKKFVEGFRYDAHPMGMLLATVGALSTFYPDANNIDDETERHMAGVRLIAKVPTLAAFAYRHNLGLPYVYPDNDHSYPGNFLSMMFKMTELKYEPDPRLERALDVLWILHADHEQNCSTAAVRAVGSSQVDPYSAAAAGVAALYGPLHGGANEQVLKMLERIETVENIPDFLEGVKNQDERLMGFGHRVYKNYDPRAELIKKHVDEVFEVTGKNPKLDIATELEKQALDDDYFVDRKLYPNVDFYSGLIYEALNLPKDMFTVMFAIPRTSGWVAQWLEMTVDDETKIARPRQIYTGDRGREYEPARGPRPEGGSSDRRGRHLGHRSRSRSEDFGVGSSADGPRTRNPGRRSALACAAAGVGHGRSGGHGPVHGAEHAEVPDPGPRREHVGRLRRHPGVRGSRPRARSRPSTPTPSTPSAGITSANGKLWTTGDQRDRRASPPRDPNSTGDLDPVTGVGGRGDRARLRREPVDHRDRHASSRSTRRPTRWAPTPSRWPACSGRDVDAANGFVWVADASAPGRVIRVTNAGVRHPVPHGRAWCRGWPRDRVPTRPMRTRARLSTSGGSRAASSRRPTAPTTRSGSRSAPTAPTGRRCSTPPSRSAGSPRAGAITTLGGLAARAAADRRRAGQHALGLASSR